jgi:hypothetical protein
MKTINLIKTSAIAFSCAVVIGLPFLNVAKKYVPRDSESALNRTFAGAAEYYHWLKMDPSTGKLNPDAMNAYLQRVGNNYMNASMFKTNSTGVIDLPWQEMGPDNVGGRCRAILVDKKNNTRMWAGSVSGGLFKSDDSGLNWAPVNDQLSSLVVSCMCQDNDGNIYFGTGEGMARGGSGDGNSAFPGNGLYLMTYNSSSDTYSTATQISSTAPVINGSTFGPWNFIQDVQVSPTKGTAGFYTIYAANNSGLYISTDGGANWTDAVTGNFGMDVDVANDGSVYVAIGPGQYSGNNKIYYRGPTDSLFTNVTPAASTTFPYSAFGRIEIAVSKTNSSIVYASVARPLSSTATLLAVYQSRDTGNTWTVIGSGNTNFLPFATYGQGDYDHILEVFPDNDFEILLGGVDLFRWEAINSSNPTVGQWTQISNGFQSPFNPTYCHADKHAITFDPNNSNTFYVGNDGGIFRTTNRGATYSEMNKGFNVTQFYALAVERDALWTYGPDLGKFNYAGIFGGAQDNGTQYISGNNNTVKSAIEVNGGDGFYTEASMLAPNTFFYTSYYGFLARSSSRDDNAADFYPERTMPGCSGTTVPGDYAFASFITPTALWESSSMTTNVDSVDFAVDSLRIPSVATGDGFAKRFILYLTKPQSSAVINVSTLKITVGNQIVNGQAGNTLSGSVDASGANIFYPGGDSVDVTFATAPAANAPIKVSAVLDYAAGSQVWMTSASLNKKFPATLPFNMSTGDTLAIHDPIQARLAVGLTGAVWMCKNPVNFSAPPAWVKIAGANSVNSLGTTASFSGTVQTLEFAGENHIFVATTTGNLYRISGLASVVDNLQGDIDSTVLSAAGVDSIWLCSRNKTSPLVCERIAGFGKAVTSISPDPSNPDRLIVTTGNYGSTSHVYFCSTATSAPISSTTANFTVIGTVDNPVYSSTFIQTYYGEPNPNYVLIGSEDGVYSIDLSNTGAGWVSEKDNVNGKFPNVPTFMLKQQTWPNWECYNSGIIYAATHGRGFWQSTKYHAPLVIGMQDIASGNKGPNKLVKAFPNPANDYTTVNFTLMEERKISINIYDLKGSKLKTVNFGKLKGTQNLGVELDGIADGTYIISVSGDGDVLGTCRFVKIN